MSEKSNEGRPPEDKPRREHVDWQNVFQAIGNPTFILDADYRLVHVNRAACAALDASEAELRGKTCYELMHNTTEPVENCPAQAIRNGARGTVEVEQEALGRTFLVSCTPVLDETGAVDRIIHVATDTTEHKRMQAELVENEEKYRALFESSRDAIMTLEPPSWGFTSGNPACIALFGAKDESEFTSFLPWLLSPERQPDGRDSAEKAKEMIEMAMREGAHFFEWVHRRLDGTEFPATVLLTRTELSGYAFLQATVRDITERKQAEEERRDLEARMQQAQKLESLGVLAGGIAHDFNNMLTGVLGNADLALAELPPESPARYSIQEAVTASMRAAELCRQMLAYSGKGRFLVEPLSLSRLVEEMAHLLETSISKKCIVRYDFAPDLPAVESDATQLRQVVMNLIINASEAIGDRSGAISIRTGLMDADRDYLAGAYMDEGLPEGTYAFIEVSDTGCGMDEETRAKVFDPFFSTKFAGRGLGLAAVLGIVRGHHGAVKIYSEPGKGTSFKILLPCADEPAVEPAQEQRTTGADWQGAGTLLVIDDEETVRAVTKRMLARHGFQVLTAPDGEQGIETFRKHAGEVVAVLLDLTMPRVGGEEAFSRLRRIRSDIPILLCSGYTEEDAVTRFAGKGLAGFVQKPYNRKTLITALRKALGV